MKRTLLDDLIEVNYLIPCETKDNNYCYRCEDCKNKLMCNMVENLINSLKKYY